MVPAHHHLAHRLTVMRHRPHGLPVDDRHMQAGDRCYPLPRLHPGDSLRTEIDPRNLPGADGVRPVQFGEPINVSDIDTDILHPLNDRWRWGGSRGEHLQGTAQLHRGSLGETDHGQENIGRGTEMRHAFLFDQAENFLRQAAPQADMGRPGRRHRPGETPAVAMKHRQGP